MNDDPQTAAARFGARGGSADRPRAEPGLLVRSRLGGGGAAALKRPVLYSLADVVEAVLAIVDELPDDPLAEAAVTQILLRQYDLAPELRRLFTR
jgi:hypothetical protein